MPIKHIFLFLMQKILLQNCLNECQRTSKVVARYKFTMFASKLTLSILRSVKSNLTSIRQMSAAINTDCVKSLLYKEYGEPVEILQVMTQTMEQPAGDQVTVKWLLSPVNPADINTIKKKYPSRPLLYQRYREMKELEK
ncbi:putative trans-2-enoyl-CoA reductase, mitochondrial [Temnothorax longispinosus]|uniref:Putative trans-2-enoyl-CoA reductase, mitochondrial n=1 Tax=Temnothorax longispinosus TaxID=300112 RepID=A0A4S2L105_9HYME|nr:putative trans-2-enoyl-CoA reductase, mitochondrial [Temnothorax longispinosus]